MEQRVTAKGLKFSTRQITVIGLLSAISIVLGMTPLGFIPIPPANATIMHIPVIIGAIVEGPVVGAMIGLIFGISSIIKAITQPNILSFAFLNPIVSVLPRVLIGITAYYAYKAIPGKSHVIKSAFAAAIGTITNTAGVLGFIYLLYIQKFAAASNISLEKAKAVIIGIAATNGIPEVLVSMAIVIPVTLIMKNVRK
ncbi:membrane protein [Fervidicella metallireducens AeB]|uniref:Membrane protein n=1 Tax=Fervidicella metallireducens AeB TaxID=1403537 RepID=A0A017RX78_9CLOT|nr:ECF transporter S component [Fervidicella metallireducens]EYE88515.1 membrane protein [Fervidicella metallireducens AeB]